MAETLSDQRVTAWHEMPDEELLKVRVSELHVRIEGTPLEDRINRLYAELDRAGLQFHPPCYLADEWLCPDGMPIIGIPFYLAHPRLIALERKMMLEAEGDTDSWCMQLLRHETGHAINYAYSIYKSDNWHHLFGPFTEPYPRKTPRRPYSRLYVNHLSDNYAQSHPDEDFAETFAVWLTPESGWEERYRGWPAMKKLQYVKQTMDEIRGKEPLVTHAETLWAASRMKSTLEAYYARKRRGLGHEYAGYYDPYLKRIFAEKPGTGRPEPAEKFLRRRRRQIVKSVAVWTGQRKFDIDKMIRSLTVRCESMQLFLRKSETETIADTAAFITAAIGTVHGFRRGLQCR